MGFIGSNLVNQLRDLDEELVLVDKIQYKGKLYKNMFFYDIEKFKNVFLKTNKFDDCTLIIHLGADSDAQSFDLESLNYYNIGFTNYIAEVAAKKNIPLIFASSAAVYGNSNPNSISPYAKSKLNSEFRILALSKIYPTWNFEILRLFNVFGPGEIHKKHMISIPTKFILSLIQNNKIEVWKFEKNGILIQQARDFIFIDDLIKYFSSKIKFNSISKKIYDIGSGQPITLYKLAKLISTLKPGTNVEIIAPPNNINLDFYQLFTKAITNKIPFELSNLTPISQALYKTFIAYKNDIK